MNALRSYWRASSAGRGHNSLRAIEATMASHQGRLYHVGGKAPARSTFADANRTRNPLVFMGLLEHLLATATRGVRRKMRMLSA